MANGYAEAALDYAMTILCEAASPWRLPSDVYDGTRAQFAGDFDAWITDQTSWLKWREIVRRQARSMGAIAAYLADLEEGKGEKLPPPGDLRLSHLATAAQFAKATCRVPPPGPSVRGRLCNGAFTDFTPSGSAGEEMLERVLKASAF
jgi:hypothetical protein